MILSNPDRFGASLEEISAGLQSVFEALDRFYRWLTGSLQTFSKQKLSNAAPNAGKRPDAEPALYGWCSERVYERGRIHSWVTANAIEFLVDFRRLNQERINSLLRAEFVSHNPNELLRLSEIEPTDLGNLDTEGKKPPTTLRLLELLQDHKALELAEGPWLPGKPPRPSISFWSGMLYGPPGASKTVLAKAIAGELRWPLISLSPSDFLARGDQQIESRAQEIFYSLSAGSRLVYFFDEIDELIRDRRQKEERSVFSFLTPSFLTKIQDLHDEAKHNEFIFLFGTNYFDRIDSAAKRSGRIDHRFPVVYPDRCSRGFIIIQHLTKALAQEGKDITEQFQVLHDILETIQRELKTIFPHANEPFMDTFATFTGFLSYPNINELTKRFAQLLKSGRRNDFNELKMIIKDLGEIDHAQSERYKPEIKLSDYAERLEALEEIKQVGALIPDKPFPLTASQEISVPRDKISQRERHVDELLKATKDPKFSADLKKALNPNSGNRRQDKRSKSRPSNSRPIR
jgi:hypothetical protein